MTGNQTVAELELLLGANVRALRLQRGISQKELATRSGLSRKAVQNIECGAGSTIGTLVSVLRALGSEDWINTLKPAVSISPIDILRRGTKIRMRATGVRRSQGQT